MARQTKSEARKEQILKAAERIFAHKGFSEATVSEVARVAGLSDATIYEYFSSKEELLFSIPLPTTRKAAQELQTHLDYIRGAVNKIRGIIYGYLAFYQNHPDHASVLMLILKQNRKFLKTEAYQLIREVSRMITRVVEEGIASNDFKSDSDPYLVRAVILGTIEHSVITWLLLDRPQNLLKLADPLKDIVINGIRKDTQPRTMNFRLTLDPLDEDQRNQT